ncbi:hypothetical protein PENTCL1PPCAC_24127, partial [Pristionchus entomophagus]
AAVQLGHHRVRPLVVRKLQEREALVLAALLVRVRALEDGTADLREVAAHLLLAQRRRDLVDGDATLDSGFRVVLLLLPFDASSPCGLTCSLVNDGRLCYGRSAEAHERSGRSAACDGDGRAAVDGRHGDTASHPYLPAVLGCTLSPAAADVVGGTADSLVSLPDHLLQHNSEGTREMEEGDAVPRVNHLSLRLADRCVQRAHLLEATRAEIGVDDGAQRAVHAVMPFMRPFMRSVHAVGVAE